MSAPTTTTEDMTMESNVKSIATADSCVEHSRKERGPGYGYEQHNGKQVLSHRLAYCKRHDIPLRDIDGMVVRHKCDNPKCINPDHLEIGTQKENMRDMDRRGRRPRGEKIGNAKLDASQIDQIRREYIPRSKSANQYVLSVKYGISQGQVSMIVNGIRWRHTLRGVSK